MDGEIYLTIDECTLNLKGEHSLYALRVGTEGSEVFVAACTDLHDGNFCVGVCPANPVSNNFSLDERETAGSSANTKFKQLIFVTPMMLY